MQNSKDTIIKLIERYGRKVEKLRLFITHINDINRHV